MAGERRPSLVAAYLLWLFFGLLGIHHFYMGRTIQGLVWLLTGGFCFLGWLIDLFLMPVYCSRAND